MSISASILKSPEPTASPAARWTLAARLAAAGTLVLAAGLQLASILIEPDTDSTVEAVQWIADHPYRADLAQVLFLIAMPFYLGTALVYVLLSRQRSPRLAYAGGILLGFGFVGLTMVAGYETLAIALAQDGRFDSTALAEVLAEMSSPPAIAMLLIFIPSAFFGLLTSAAALWRSRAVPRGAAILIATFILVDLFLNEGLGLVSSSAAHAIWFVATCWIASAVLLARRAVPTARPENEESE
jgi:hypothetical protein